MMELYDLDTESFIRWRTKEAARAWIDDLPTYDLEDLARERLGRYVDYDSFDGQLLEALIARITTELH